MLEKINRRKNSPKNKVLLNTKIKSGKCENKLCSSKNITPDKIHKKLKKSSNTVALYKLVPSKLSQYQNEGKYLKEIDPYKSVPVIKPLTKNDAKKNVIEIIEFVNESTTSIDENSDPDLNYDSKSGKTISTFSSEQKLSSTSIDLTYDSEQDDSKMGIIDEEIRNDMLNEVLKNVETIDEFLNIDVESSQRSNSQLEINELNIDIDESKNPIYTISQNKDLHITNTNNNLIKSNNKMVEFKVVNKLIVPSNETIKSNVNSCDTEEPKLVETSDINISDIPEVLRKQGTATNCSSNVENDCPCNTMEDIEQVSKQITYCNRKTWITVERMNELRKKAQDALKNNKTFTIRGCFFSIRNALTSRGWVEKLDVHRKHTPNGVCQVTYEDLASTLPKRRPGESRRQYVIKCERNIMSRFLEHMPINFLWTARKEKCDYIDQGKNPSLIINKFARVPFTTKEGLCNQLKDFHWFYEEGTSELYFPRCYNAWSPEDLSDFIENYRTTACICYLKYLINNYRQNGPDNCFSVNGKIPISSIDFARKRCNNYIDICYHKDIDTDNDNENNHIWEHDWDLFYTQHIILTQENGKIISDDNRNYESLILSCEKILQQIEEYWPQYNLDGYLNLWIIKPANKCRGRGIHLTNNLKKIMHIVNPAITSKSRHVVQKYIERPLVIHNAKFDIRQWFMVTSVQPLVIWMYRESYLRFSTQDFNLRNHHESVHLTNHAIQKKYRINGKRDKRLPNENMWDCYSFQAYLRQIGKHKMWSERIYPGMRSAIIGSILASQDSMDRRASTFELFGADFMISEDFYPWLIEINSSPDLGATTSVTARMCPQCLEDAIKVIIDKRIDIKADTGNFELIYRQNIPPTLAYMGLNLFLKGKQILPRNTNHHYNQNHHYHHHLHRNKERSSTSLAIQRQSMPTINFQGSPPRINTGGNPEINSVLQFMDKSSNCNHREFSTNQHIFTMDSTNYPQMSNNRQSIKSNQILQQTSDTSVQNLCTQQSSRLLTPIIPMKTQQSQYNRTIGTQKLMLSPRGTLIGDRKRSKELLNWKNHNDKTKSITSMTELKRRHYSCGPRITTSEANIKNVVNNSGDLQQQNVLENNENILKEDNCKFNSISLDNISQNQLDNAEITLNVCRKKVYEMLYKSKSAKRYNRLAKTSCALSIKGSSNSITSINNNISSSSALSSYRKSCLLNGNSSINSIIGHNSGGGNHTKERLSFRAWRSKQLTQENGNDIINCKSSVSAIPCKSAPTLNLSPNKRRIENNGGCMMINNSNINLPTRTRQLCNNIKKKEYQNHLNTRC